MAFVNTEGLTEPTGTRTYETDVLDTTARKHQVDTSPRFTGSDKHCRTWQAKAQARFEIKNLVRRHGP
jgi:serine/threonine-protein kinase RIO1